MKKIFFVAIFFITSCDDNRPKPNYNYEVYNTEKRGYANESATINIVTNGNYQKDTLLDISAYERRNYIAYEGVMIYFFDSTYRKGYPYAHCWYSNIDGGNTKDAYGDSVEYYRNP